MKLLFLSFVAMSSAVAASALEWKVTELTVKVAPLQSTTEAAFAFTNRGAKPVTITSVDTSCDCLDAEPSDKVIAPGATGSIRARFTVGGLHGIYHRTITVASDDTPEPVQLTVELQVPEVATLTPRSLEWPLHGPADAKVVEIDIAEGLTLSVGDVVPTSEAFTAHLETVEAGRRYRVAITPRDTAKAVSAAFRIHATTPAGKAVIFSAYGNVR